VSSRTRCPQTNEYSLTPVDLVAEWYALLVVVVVVTVLLSSNHDTIVEFMRPVGTKIRGWPGGWVRFVVLGVSDGVVLTLSGTCSCYSSSPSSCL
jgi:hypothetical protein